MTLSRCLRAGRTVLLSALLLLRLSLSFDAKTIAICDQSPPLLYACAANFTINPTTAPPNTSQAEFTLNRNASAALTTAIAPASGVTTAARAN